tara:strand:- start:12427 stop:13350 length:924 start_codon:yes stop_codon:yes gene_type:complete
MGVRIYSAEKEEGVALWPEERPWEWLMSKKAKMPGPMYYSQYCNDPSGLKGVRYNLDWLRFYTQVSLPHISEMSGVQAGDPATSERESSNYFGHSTLARHNTSGVIYVLDIDFGHIPATDHLEFLKSRYDIWMSRGLNIYKVILESVGPQQATTQHLVESTRMNNGGYMPIEELNPKGSKEQRYDTLLPFFKTGTILFPGEVKGDGSVEIAENHFGFKEFKQEFMGFPKHGRDDVLDAVWMGAQELLSRSAAAGETEGRVVPEVETIQEGRERRLREYENRESTQESPRERVLSRMSRGGMFHRGLR